jgi:hypothetical protein
MTCSLALHLAQHADEYRSERPVLHVADQRLGEGAAFRMLQNSPMRSAPSKSGSITTWSSSARERGRSPRDALGVGVPADQGASGVGPTPPR